MGVFEKYLKTIEGYPDFRHDLREAEALVLKMRQEDVQAKLALIKSTLNFIAQLAKKYCQKLNAWPHFEDLVQEGNKKVLARIIHYKPEKNSSLAAFIHFTARTAFFDYLYKAKVVNFTDYRRQMRREIRKAHEELSKELKREPTVEEISEYLDMDESRVREFVTHAIVTTLEIDALPDGDAAANVIEMHRHPHDKASLHNSPLDLAINAEKLEFAAECLGREEADLLIAYKTHGVEFFLDLYFRRTGKRKTKDGARQYIRRRVAKLEKYMQKKTRLRAIGGNYGFHATYSK